MSAGIKVTIIGSGTGALTAERGTSGYIIETCGELFLLDGGSGTLRQCLNAGFSYKDIDRVFYSHLHPDHTIDLVPLLFATKYTPDFNRLKPLYFYGPVGFKEFFAKYVGLFNAEIMKGDYAVSVEEISERELAIGRLKIKTALMAHTENAMGLRFELDGKAVVYSGDTDVCDNIIELAKGAALLILECSFPDEKKITGHLTPSEAGMIAAEAEVEKMILTHLYPPVNEKSLRFMAKRQFSGDIIVAHDLLKIEI